MAGMSAEKISESELKRVCDDLYGDRFEIYAFNPGASHNEALLWMLVGCLISLLSVNEEELRTLFDSSGPTSYADAVCKLLEGRTQPPFDVRAVVDELTKRVESE
jgi:hypothetical protein